MGLKDKDEDATLGEEEAEFDLSQDLDDATASKFAPLLVRDRAMKRCVFEAMCAYDPTLEDTEDFYHIMKWFANSERFKELLGRKEGDDSKMKKWMTAALSIHMYAKNPGPYTGCNESSAHKNFCENAAVMDAAMTEKKGVCEACMKNAGTTTAPTTTPTTTGGDDDDATASIQGSLDLKDLLAEIAGDGKDTDALADLETGTYSCPADGGWGLM